MDIPEALPLIFCDRTRIREVVLNLLSNAGRFTENGGIQVRAWQANKDVVVSIADTGPGIAEADQDKLFKPFHQLEHPVRRHYGGSGLGLSISKNFVELHDGRMWIESQPGRGTTVFFQLPIDSAPPEDRSARRWFNVYQPYDKHVRVAHLQLPVVRPRLVVLEKGDALQHLLHRYLVEAEIVPTADLEQACQELAQVPSQALLINDMEVGEALQRVHEFAGLPPGVPVMVCSIPGLEQTTSALGVVDYLVKPVGREVLLASLDRLGRPVQTVLIVDDAPDALQLFGRMLDMAGRGYRVWRASDGSQALEICRMQRPDVILLDLMMPEMDGFQFLRARKMEPTLAEVPVILISARDPLGKPIVSNVLALTRKDGLSVQQLLAGVEALKQILSPANLPTDPALPATAPD